MRDQENANSFEAKTQLIPTCLLLLVYSEQNLDLFVRQQKDETESHWVPL